MDQESNHKQTITTITTLANIIRAIADISKRWVVSLWLLFLYVLCMALVMSSLSGALFQEKLSKIEKPAKFSGYRELILKKEGQNIPPERDDSETERIAREVIKLVEVKKRTTESDERKNYYSLNEIILGYEIWKSASSTKILSYSKANNDEKERIRKELEPKKKQEKSSPESIETTKTAAKQEEINSLPKAAGIENRETGETLDINNLSEKKSLYQEIKTKLTEWIKLKLGIKNIDPSISDPKTDNFNTYRDKATLNFIAVFGHDGQIVSYFLEADKFNSFFTPIKNILQFITFGTLHDHFWTYPRPILKLNLIFSMGILGSLIFVTMEFLKYPYKHSLEMYFFRPFLGMIIALAMYVMVKSGYSALLEGNDKDLSPFFISFLGIISGMLADQAYSNISFTGLTYLSRKPAETPETPKKPETPATSAASDHPETPEAPETPGKPDKP